MILTSCIQVSADQGKQKNVIASDTQILFGKAIKLRKKGKFHHALKLFNEIQKDNPKYTRVKLELALTYYQLGEYERAMLLVEKVLSDKTIPKVVRMRSERFYVRIKQHLLKQKPAENVVKGTIRLLAAADNNVNLVPEDAELDEGHLPKSFTVHSDRYYEASLFLRHHYDINSGDSSASWVWKNGFDSSTKKHQARGEADLDVISAYTGIAVRTKQNWRINLKLKMAHYRFGGKPFANYNSIEPAFSYVFARSLLKFKIVYTDRDYKQSEDKIWEGQQVGIGADWYHSLPSNRSLRVGIKTVDTNLKDDAQSYLGLYGFVSASQVFKYGISSAVAFHYGHNTYDSPNQYYSVKRDDKIRRGIFSIDYPVKTNLSVGVRYSYTERASNNDVYSYDRNRIAVYVDYDFKL